MNKNIYLKDLQTKSYRQTWNLQTELLDKIVAVKTANRSKEEKQATSNYFLFVEHPDVYTIGKSGNINNLLINQRELAKRGVEFHKTNRGGDITYHGPGQVVGYPILDLENFFTDIHKYLRLLEQTVIRTLSEYGLEGQRSQGETGVWLDVGTAFARKICAIGVRTSRWVTMHGFALNVNTDLSYFDHIVPCGIRDKAVTSLKAELGAKIPMEEVKQKILFHFGELFEVNQFSQF